MSGLRLDDDDLGRRLASALGDLAETSVRNYESTAAAAWRLWSEMGGDIRPAPEWPIKRLSADLEDLLRASRLVWVSAARNGLDEACGWERLHAWPEVWEADVARISAALGALPGDMGERRLVRAVGRSCEHVGVREPGVPRRQLLHLPPEVYKQWGWLSALCEVYPQRLAAHVAHAMDGAEHAFARQDRQSRSSSRSSGSSRPSGPFGFGWG